MIQTILVPLDGSAFANRATDYAIDLATRYRARLVFLYVVDNALKKSPADLHQFAVAEHLDGTAETGLIVDRILHGAESRAKQAGLDDVVSQSCAGDPAEAILDAVKSHKADAIIMGSRGMGTLKGLLIGSVSRKVLDHADVPVTITR